MVDDAYQSKSRRHDFKTVRRFIAPTFEIDTERSARCLYLLEIATFRNFDYRFGLNGIIAFGNIVDKLFQNMERLHDFFETHIIACIRIALTRQHFFKLHFVISRIRSTFTHIARPTRRTPRRACRIVTYGIFERKMSYTYHTITRNDITGKYLIIFFQSGRHNLDKLLDFALEVGMNIGHDATDGIIVHRHTGTAGLFENIENQLPFPETVEESGKRTEVHAQCREKQKVRRYTHELVHHRADILGTLGHFELHGIFDTHTQSMSVLVSREVIETVGHVQGLGISHSLPQFFDTPVYISAMYIDFLYDLAFERGTETQYAVRSRVLRTDIDDIIVFLENVNNFFLDFSVSAHTQRYGRIGTLFIRLGNRIVFTTGIVIFPHGITDPVLPQEYTAHIGVSDKAYTVKIVHFPFFEIGIFPNIAHTVQQRILTVGRHNFENHPMIVFYRIQVIDHAEGFAPIDTDKGCKVIELQLVFVAQIARQNGQLLGRDCKCRILTFFKNGYLFLYICHQRKSYQVNLRILLSVFVPDGLRRQRNFQASLCAATASYRKAWPRDEADNREYTHRQAKFLPHH